MMKLLRGRGMPPDLEVCVTVGMCYLTYYVANAPLHLSGVIAVVVFGLYGSATLKWDMSAVASREHFPRFWDVLGQVLLPPAAQKRQLTYVFEVQLCCQQAILILVVTLSSFEVLMYMDRYQKCFSPD